MSEPTTDALLKRAREAGKHWLAACLRIGMDEQVVMPLAAEQSAALAALADRVQESSDNRTTGRSRQQAAEATVTRLEAELAARRCTDGMAARYAAQATVTRLEAARSAPLVAMTRTARSTTVDAASWLSASESEPFVGAVEDRMPRERDELRGRPACARRSRGDRVHRLSGHTRLGKRPARPTRPPSGGRAVYR